MKLNVLQSLQVPETVLFDFECFELRLEGANLPKLWRTESRFGQTPGTHTLATTLFPG